MLNRSFESLRPGFLGLVGPLRLARIAAAAAALAATGLVARFADAQEGRGCFDIVAANQFGD